VDGAARRALHPPHPGVPQEPCRRRSHDRCSIRRHAGAARRTRNTSGRAAAIKNAGFPADAAVILAPRPFVVPRRLGGNHKPMTQEPGQAPAGPGLTALPRYEDIPPAGDGMDPDRYRVEYDAVLTSDATTTTQMRYLWYGVSLP